MIKCLENNKGNMKKTKLKTIELHENTTAVFTGSQELRQFIINNCEYDIENTKKLDYHIDLLNDEDLKVDENIKNELDLLISELSNRNLSYLSILKQ